MESEPSEVDERRDGAMPQVEKPVTPDGPPRVIVRPAALRDDEHDFCSGGEIDRALGVDRREPVCYEVHAQLPVPVALQEFRPARALPRVAGRMPETGRFFI
jgi:hypothetical protein